MGKRGSRTRVAHACDNRIGGAALGVGGMRRLCSGRSFPSLELGGCVWVEIVDVFFSPGELFDLFLRILPQFSHNNLS